jgi:CRP-like cAMP-binding protein
LRLPRIAFEGLCEKYPEAMSRLADFITPVAHETLLARVICDLLGERDAAQLAALLAEVECLDLKRGDILVREGEDADRMFVVISGRLRIMARDAEGTETVIDEIGRGDTVGERSLLTGDLRSATVYALRDSAVGVITRPLFENLKRQYPEVLTRLARIALRRVQRRAATPGAFHTPDAVGFAVLPAGTPAAAFRFRPLQGRLASACRLVRSTLSSARPEASAGHSPGGRRIPPSPCWLPGCSGRSKAIAT